MTDKLNKTPTEVMLAQDIRFFEISDDLMVVAGTDGYFQRLNGAWEKTLGWSMEELLADTFLSFVHPDDVEPTLKEVERQVRGEKVIQFENRYRCKDGSYRWLEWTSAADPDGTIFAVARDKTEQKATQIERDRFFEISIDLLVIANTDGTFKKINERWQEVLGWTKEELMSRPFMDFVHPEDVEPTIAELEKQKLGEQAIRFDNRYRCKDGSYRWLEWTTQPEPDGTIYAIARDITEQREAERKLIKAQHDAEEANLAKSKFLAAMSHDLRTPLNAIMGFSDMMRQKAFGALGSPHYEEYADDIYNSGQVLVSLINDILDLSKIEAGKYELAEEMVNLDSIISLSMHQLEGMAKRGNIAMNKKIPSHFPMILGDQRALLQVLNNLISNAIKFTNKKGSVICETAITEENSIQICVRDTGIGMSSDDIEKALIPFEQIDGNLARQNHGTGLGLHLCVNFMKLFGGSLEIDSEVNKGTNVTLTFPSARTKQIM